MIENEPIMIKLKLNKSVLLALVLAVVAVVWIGSGILFSGSSEADNQTADTEQEGSAELVQVRVRDLQSEPYVRQVRITAISKASRTVTLKAEAEGRVVALNHEKGAVVSDGEGLARIELRDRADRVSEAEKLVEQREIEYNASKSLQTKGFNSKIRLAEAGAQLEAAKAALTKAKDEMEKLIIMAPFDGVLSEQNIEVGDYVSIGNPAYTIVDLDPLELHGFISERDVMFLEQGTKVIIRFLNGEETYGELSFVSPRADVNTRTFPIEITLPNTDGEYLDGLTADMIIPLETVSACKLSPSVLSLADDGSVGVKLVDQNDRVKFHTVEALSDKSDGIWIGGLPENVRIITVGHEFVVDGQHVKPVVSDAKGAL